jgi:putative transposase
MALPEISWQKSLQARVNGLEGGKMKRFETLSHSKWECKYHVVWIPKYRRKDLYGIKRRIVVDTIKKWCRIKGVRIVEGHAMGDHIHLCLSIPPKYAVSALVGLLKGKSASEVMSFGSRSNRMARGRQFWARGYCVSTVGLDEHTIRAYIRNQEVEDKKVDQLELL